MSHKHALLVLGLCVCSRPVLAQTTPPERPHLTMWPTSYAVQNYTTPDLRNPSGGVIPMTRDDADCLTDSANPDACPQYAAAFLFNELLHDLNDQNGAGVGWIDHDHVALFKRGIAVALQVFGSTTNPDTDSATQRTATWNSPRSKGDRDSLGTDKSFMKSSISLA